MILRLVRSISQEVLTPGLEDARQAWALARERMRSEKPRLRPATPTPLVVEVEEVGA